MSIHELSRLRGWPAVLLLITLLFVAEVRAAYDDRTLQYPLENLCRRWDHQSIVLNNKLYLLGGHVLLQEHVANNSRNNFAGEPSSEFIELDLTQSFSVLKDVDNATFPPWTRVDYTTSEANVNLAISAGAMWTSDDKIYVYDGMHTKNATITDESTLWSYDTSSKELVLEDHWVQDDQETPYRYARGTSVDVPQKGLGFYVGGARMFKDGDEEAWYYPLKDQLLQMDIGNGDFSRNFQPLIRGRKTMGAAVTWIPVGEMGSLVMIGGTDEENERTQSPSNGRNVTDSPPVDSAMARKEEVWIYDIKNAQWYIQETTGKGPYERMNACIVAASAPDKSSHQIFLYGGGSGDSMFGLDDGSYMGDLYVLNLPTFEWFQYVDLANPPTARTRHTCHVINNRQLLVVGGTRNDTGTNLEHTCVWDEISLLDMSTLEWQTEYTPSTAAYSVPDDVLRNSQYNGKPKTAPATGWSSQQLEALFNGGNTGPPRSAIIGGAVGGGVALLLIIAIAMWIDRRRKKRRQSQCNAEEAQEGGPLGNQHMSLTPGTPTPQYQQFAAADAACAVHANADAKVTYFGVMRNSPLHPVELHSEPVIFELPESESPNQRYPQHNPVSPPATETTSQPYYRLSAPISRQQAGGDTWRNKLQ